MSPPARPTARRAPSSAAPRAKGRDATAAPGAGPVPIGTIPLSAGSKPHPALGLGLWGLGRWTPEDEARTKATIGRAFERGMRWFDTAEVYGAGRSERILGDVLARAGAASPPPFVVTKVSWEHLRSAQVRASLIRSLERLARPSVDLYLVHAPDPHVPLEETMPTLEALWKEGRVGAIGVSNFSVEELEEAARHLSETRIVVNQIRMSLLDHRDADGLAAYCRTHGILLEAYSPLARGLLTGRYLGGRRLPPAVRRLTEEALDPEAEQALVERARLLEALAKESGVPLASLALHWIRRRGAAPVFGASRPEQVDQNLAAWTTVPSDAVLDRADAIAGGERA
jgi:myo-inositol catabolism protein IolS